MRKREDIKQLFERYRTGQCTPEEQARLHAWFNHHTRDEAAGLDQLREAYEAKQAVLRRKRLGWLPYAAAIVLVLAVGILVWEQKQVGEEQGPESVATDVMPGGNRATLTLADGRTIDLSSDQNGIVVGDGIAYLDGSKVLEQGEGINEQGQDSPSGTENGNTQNAILTTPKGGTYQVTLSDGTKVWLNAGSTLTYPSRFTGNERVVELKGEAYFEVSSQQTAKKTPFKVITNGQAVEVLGTQFNISAYPDDPETRTTLVEGTVQIVNRQSKIVNRLQPGQQSIVRGVDINVQNVDVSPYVAWKDGTFYFDNTPLPDIMRQMARWYDVEVVYEGEAPQELFSGEMSRNVTLQTVLLLLHVSEIKYRIEGNKLIIG